MQPAVLSNGDVYTQSRSCVNLSIGKIRKVKFKDNFGVNSRHKREPLLPKKEKETFGELKACFVDDSL